MPMLVDEIKRKGMSRETRDMKGWEGQVIIHETKGTPKGFWAENAKEGETLYASCEVMSPGNTTFEGKKCRVMSCRPDAEEGACKTDTTPYIKLLNLTLKPVRTWDDLEPEPNARQFFK